MMGKVEVKYIKEGQIVWAKLTGYDWWPGMIVPASLCKPIMGCNNDHLCLYWYGHNSVSKLERSLKMCNFAQGFRKYNLRNGTKLFKYGVIQAAKDLMVMQKKIVPEHVTHQEVLAWISSADFQDGDGEWKLSVFVHDQLQLLSARFGSESSSHTSPKVNENTSENSQEKWLNNPSLCLSCGSPDTELFFDHPIFDQSICSSCLENFKCDYFVPKANGILDHPFSELTHRGSICFLCDKKSLGAPVRNCWRENLFDMFHLKLHLDSQIVLSETHPNILCFNASNSTGEALCAYIKEALGIQYFKLFFYGATARPGDDAKSAAHLRNTEEALNCTITYISNISMFPSVGANYIIVSTPGDSGIGPKFFNFYQIVNSKKSFKWLFQMQPPFCKKYIALISRFLECQPGLWRHSESSRNCTWTSERSLLKLFEEPMYNEGLNLI